jgi:hypothetical protein
MRMMVNAMMTLDFTVLPQIVFLRFQCLQEYSLHSATVFVTWLLLVHASFVLAVSIINFIFKVFWLNTPSGSKRNRVGPSPPSNSIELQQRRVMVLQNPLVVSPASFVYRTHPQNPIPPPMQTTLPVRQNIYTPTPPPPHENTPPTKPTIAEPPPQNELKLGNNHNTCAFYVSKLLLQLLWNNFFTHTYVC